MKFLTFVDLHQDKDVLRKLVTRAKKSDIDFILAAGDVSDFGRGLREVLEAFSKVGKTMYFIPGNHEEHMDWEKMIAKYPYVINLHRQDIKIDDYVFLGYGGGGFAQEEAEFRKIARNWYGQYHGKKIVLVTHGPPFLTKLDWLEHLDRHVGHKDYRKFIERIEPKIVICGHLHETAGLTDKIGKTKLLHPGWDGLVIELK
jgi:uncharacterized protein